MNPENSSKKGKFSCGCCAKEEEFNDSDKVIFDYFGKEFTEYEYVIENLAIRPAPKKLLDLVPVHSTNITLRERANKTSNKNNNSGEPMQSLPKMEMSRNINQPSTGEGDCRQTEKNTLKIQDDNDFISFREYDVKCISKPLNCSSSCPTDPRVINDITELRQTIRTKEYRTTKQVLTDLCEASQRSLNIKPKPAIENKQMSSEILSTINQLKFQKPLPQYFTRTEKRFVETPAVYFSEVKSDFPSRPKKTSEKHPKDTTYNPDRKSSNSTVDILNPRLDAHSNETKSYAVDSMVQTDISNACPYLKKEKKNLKWRIIINKHANCKL